VDKRTTLRRPARWGVMLVWCECLLCGVAEVWTGKRGNTSTV